MIAAFTTLALLKRQLGELGRADFVQNVDFLPGDLIWLDEEVVVILTPCWTYACPHHTRELSEKQREQGEQRLKKVERAIEKYRKAGWNVIHYYDCQVLDGPKACAIQIAQALVNRRKVDAAEEWEGINIKVAKIARAIHYDGAARLGEMRWTQFMETIGTAHNRWSRKDVEFVLRDKGWTDKEFALAWSIARHHDLIRSDTNGYCAGPMLMPTCHVVGLMHPPKRPQKKGKKNGR